MIIKAYSSEDIKNNKKLIKDIKIYQKNFPCCNRFPTCTHPNFQTDARVHCSFPELESSYFNNLKKYLKDIQCSTDMEKYKVLDFKMWSFIFKANEKSSLKWCNRRLWHHHSITPFKEDTLEISSLSYLTATKIATMFDLEYVQIHLKPKLGVWFFWPSELRHCTEEIKINKKERVILATAIILKKK